MFPTVIHLEDKAPPSIAQVGGKGKSLLDCSQAGFDVPGGFVLTVSFWEPWMEQIEATTEFQSFLNNEGKQKDACDSVKTWCLNLQFTVEQQQELDAAISRAFGDDDTVLVAVRSSSPEEDLVKTSFAGGYETTLGVTVHRRDELLQAIRHSFASVFDFRVVQYKLQHKLDISNPRIAIVIQQQINSHVSGVAFSLNPQNNCYDEAVISSNFGLGESVVAGVVTPDTFVVDKVRMEVLSKSISQSKDHAIMLQSTGGVVEEKKENPAVASLTTDQVIAISRLVTRVEEHMAIPADIEWAIDAQGKLFLLQARPITTHLPLFPEMVTKPGEPKQLYFDMLVLTQGIDEPMSVLGLDLFKRFISTIKSDFIYAPDGHVWFLNGRMYLNVSVLMGTRPGGYRLATNVLPKLGGQVRRVMQQEGLLKSYIPAQIAPRNHGMVRRALTKLLPGLPRFLWRLFWWNPLRDGNRIMSPYIAQCDEAFARFGRNGTEEEKRRQAESDTTFAVQTNNALGWFQSAIPNAIFWVSSFYSKWRLGHIFRGHSAAQDLLVALQMDLTGNPTSEMGHEMVKLASYGELQQTESQDEFLSKLESNEYPADFQLAYGRFLQRYGCRGMKEIDIATPRSYENQADLFDRIKQIDPNRNQITNVKKRKTQAYAALLEYAANLGPRAQQNFEYHAKAIACTAGYREHPKFMLVNMVAYLRRYALEIGHELVKEGRLDDANDVFHLHIDQLTQAQQDAAIDLKAIIKENLAPYQAVEHIKSWPTMIDSRGKILRAPPDRVEEGALVGDAISAGTVRGRAKVLASPYEKPLEPREILVTKATEPSWTPIFLHAGGVVLEVGGPLQHGAIIAREYGIPCVSGVENAMQDIRDGDLLEVDGTNGIVRLVDEGE